MGEKCALDFPINSHCPTQGCVSFDNITLRNVLVDGTAWLSPGVVIGNDTTPNMRNITFDNVTFTKPGHFPYHGKYYCEHVFGTVTASKPDPGCFL